VKEKKKGWEEDIQPQVKANLAACRTGGGHQARLGEAELCDHVILLMELKGDSATWLGVQ
jgi:hypothetical protein